MAKPSPVMQSVGTDQPGQPPMRRAMISSNSPATMMKTPPSKSVFGFCCARGGVAVETAVVGYMFEEAGEGDDGGVEVAAEILNGTRPRLSRASSHPNPISTSTGKRRRTDFRPLICASKA